MKNMVKKKRFKTLLRTLPFKFEELLPKEKYINNDSNPPNVRIKFLKITILKTLIVSQMKKTLGENQN